MKTKSVQLSVSLVIFSRIDCRCARARELPVHGSQEKYTPVVNRVKVCGKQFVY